MRTRAAAAIVGCSLAAFVTASSSATAAERLYQRDVAKLIDQANKGLGKFVGNMKGKAKGAKVTREGVEYDVSDTLDDLEAEGARLEQRFSDDGKAAPTALAFLQKSKAVDGFIGRNPGWSGADQQWEALRPTLASLADAYHIDWNGDPDSWTPLRSSDAEVGGWAKQLDQDIKGYAAALSKAGKEAAIDREARATLEQEFKALAGRAKTLQKTLSSRAPASNALESLTHGAKQVSDRAASLGLGDAAAAASEPLEATLAKLYGALVASNTPSG